MKNLIIEKIVKKITKNILSEGSLDKPILDISREVIRLFKNEESDVFRYIFYRSGEEVQLLVEVDFEVVENHNEPFEVYGEAGYDELYVLIIYDPQAFPSSMNDLVAEVKETITHELEHIVQQNFEDAYISPHESDYSQDKRGGGFNYYVKKIEIPAFVKGLIKRARTKKISLDMAMDEWYKENHRNFENENDWKDVKRIWIDYANEMRKKEKVKKFK